MHVGKPHPPVLIIGLGFLLGGINLLLKGNIWNLVLGNERYWIGGVSVVFGVVVLTASFFKSD